jgi:hypothetical protein
LIPEAVPARKRGAASNSSSGGGIMKKQIFGGAVVIILGLLIATGPQFLFKVCAHEEGSFPRCHWSAQAEIGIGLLIAALGICIIVFADTKIHLGLFIGIFLSAIIALFIPHTLIGGCGMMSMRCRRVAFPFITLFSIMLLIYSAISAVFLNQAKGSNAPS